MARGKTLSVVFKSNLQNQGMLLPPDLSDLIASNHPVRVVNEVLEKVDITVFCGEYKCRKQCFFWCKGSSCR